jgi:hypothetical protein
LKVVLAGSNPSGNPAPGTDFFLFGGGLGAGAIASRHSEHGKRFAAMSAAQTCIVWSSTKKTLPQAHVTLCWGSGIAALDFKDVVVDVGLL